MKLLPVVAISTPMIVLWVIIAILIIALIALTVYGSKEKKKADEAQKQLEASAVPTSLLIIDKKRMPLKDAGLPKIVMENIPKRMRRSKAPVVKAKVGPKIMTFMTDEKVFEIIPVKQEVKAMVSGIYILSVKSVRGPALVAPPKKKGFFSRLFNKNK